MEKVSKFLMTLAAFALTEASFALTATSNESPAIAPVRTGDILRTSSDACKDNGISEADGMLYTCSRVFRCSDRQDYVFMYGMQWLGQTETTNIAAACSRQNSANLASCQTEKATPSLVACWNEAIDQGLLRNQKKMVDGTASRPTISCWPSEKISDGGYFVSINKNGGVYDYSFDQNSFSGPRSLARDRVEVTRGAAGPRSCTLTVTSATTGRDRFQILMENGAHIGKLIPALNSGAEVPDLQCNVDLGLLRQLCGTPIARPQFDSPPIIPGGAGEDAVRER